jgi:hypothetical protein
MTTKTSKIWVAVSAFAIAAAATLTPVVAQAAPADDTDTSAEPTVTSVGDSAGTPTPRRAARPVSRGQAPASTPAAGPSRSSIAISGDSVAGNAPTAGATGSNPLFQNPLWWFGTPNPTPPPAAYTRTFDPLSSLPGWTTAYSGWYQNMNFEACVLGLSNTTVQSAGPYGTATNSVSTGGC